ncbi:TPA: hypothetical protein ACIZBK_003142 [Legionella pneumophila]
MNNERIQLLVNNIHGLTKLLQRGVTLSQIGLIDLNILKNHLSSSWKLDDALLFVTIQQILGLNHVPPAVSSIVMPKDEMGTYIYIGSWGGGSFGPFSYEHSDNEIKITHANKTKSVKSTLKVTFGEVKKEYLSNLNKEIVNLLPEKLVHNWYLIAKESNTSNDNVTSLYCPELKCLIQETSQSQFPEKEFRESGYSTLLSVPYYKEKDFIDFLIKKGSSLDELRNLNGFTEIKINALCKNKYELSDLLEKGIKFTDLAKIDEDRLVHVLSNFNKAKAALEFVDVFELLGLRDTSSNYSPRMFHSQTSNVSIHAPTEEVQQGSFCQII